MTILAIALGWLAFALLLAWCWHRLRAHGKRMEAEIDKPCPIWPNKCPVCNGQGTVSKPPYVAGDQPTWTASDSTLYPCPACKGTGVIWERD